MIELFKYLLSAATATWIINQSKIFMPLRCEITRQRIAINTKRQESGLNIFGQAKLSFLTFIDSLTDCYACMGFWVGLTFYPLYIHEINLLAWLFYCIMASGSSLLFGSLTKFLNK